MSAYPHTCSICLEDISLNEDNITTLECKHPFHTHCISHLRSNKCPSCRRRFENISPEILSQIHQRETSDIVSRNTENLNLIFNNFIDSFPPGGLLTTLGLVFPPPNPPSRCPLNDIASVVESVFPSVGQGLFILLNTQFNGVTLNSILEDYIVRHGQRTTAEGG